MKIVKVVYTVHAEFSEKNQENIRKVMSDLRSLNNKNINYFSCISNDNKTFIHTAFFNSEEDQKALNELHSFIQFQKELNSAGFEVSPKPESLSLVGSSKDIF